MGILILAAGFGTVLKFVIDGSDEQETADAIEKFFNTDYEAIDNENKK
jgi:phosphotransferase system HPr-like phosphotransfer protein